MTASGFQMGAVEFRLRVGSSCLRASGIRLAEGENGMRASGNQMAEGVAGLRPELFCMCTGGALLFHRLNF